MTARAFWLNARIAAGGNDNDTHIEGEDYVTRVEGITVTPMAVPIDEPVGEGLDDLDDLDDDDPEVDPAIEDALGQLVQAAPEHFPMGLGTIAERLSTVRYGPVVEGDTLVEGDGARLRRVLGDAPLVEGRLISRDHTTTARESTTATRTETTAALAATSVRAPRSCSEMNIARATTSTPASMPSTGTTATSTSCHALLIFAMCEKIVGIVS